MAFGFSNLDWQIIVHDWSGFWSSPFLNSSNGKRSSQIPIAKFAFFLSVIFAPVLNLIQSIVSELLILRPKKIFE